MQDTENFYHAILNAIPIPIFIVDEELAIHDLNAAAINAFGLDRAQVLRQRGGDALHCLHSTETAEGCGHAPHCSDCVIRNSVTSCLAGQAMHRQRMKFTAVRNGQSSDLELLITAAPLAPFTGKRSLLIVEDITELTMLKNIIPICMHCKRVRDDGQYWQRVEGYFHRFIGVEFSHGVCPDCLKKHYPDMLR